MAKFKTALLKVMSDLQAWLRWNTKLTKGEHKRSQKD